MKRTTSFAAAVTVGLAASGAAWGQADNPGDLSPVHPVTGNVEAVGEAQDNGNALVLVSLDNVGTNVANADTTDGVFQLQFYDAAGNTILGLQDVPGADVTEFQDAGTGGTAETGDIYQLDVSAFFAAFGTAWSFDVIFNDGDGNTDGLVSNDDGFPDAPMDGAGGDDATDTLFEINRNRPTLDEALIDDTDDDGDDDTLFLVFSFDELGPDDDVNNSLKFADNAGVDNPNDSDETAMGTADFEFSTDGGSTFMNFAAEDIGSVAAIGDNDIFLQININDPTMTNLEPGVTVRVDAAAGDVFDGTGNQAQGQVEIEEKADFVLEQAEWIVSFGENSGAVNQAIRVTFNNPLDATGNAAFYDQLMLGGSASDVSVTGVTQDPEDLSSVLLDVDGGGTNNDDVAPDGADTASADTFTLNLDEGTGTSPSDIFGDMFDMDNPAPTVDVGDGINPSLEGTPMTLDEDGDGKIDAFAWNFDEPIDAGDASTDGVTLTKVATTVHPFSLFLTNLNDNDITDPTDAMNEATVTPGMNPEFSVSSVAVQNEDPSASTTDDGASRLDAENQLVFRFDPDAVDWDNDGNTGDDDTDGEATPGTFDTAFANVDLTAGDLGVNDMNANAFDTDTANDVDTDAAGPVAAVAEFITGDNLDAGGMQKISEKEADGTEPEPGDTDELGDQDDNDTLRLIFNEALNDDDVAGNIGAWRFGPSADERFQNAGDFLGISGGGNNIVQFEDNSAGGLDPGDMITVASGNGLEDANNNAYPGTSGSGAPSLTAADASASYVLLVQDVNGNAIHSAFFSLDDAGDFATEINLTMSAPVKTDTVDDSDFSVEGVDDAEVTASADENTITISLPENEIGADNMVTVTYNGSTDETPIASDEGNMGAVAAMDDTFTARRIPEPTVDGEFTSVMDIGGNTQDADENAFPDGTGIFGFIAVPVAKEIRFTMGNVTTVVDDASSLEAITNRILGIEQFVYLLIDGEDMFFSNTKEIAGVDAFIQLNLNFNNLSNVNFGGNGTTTVTPGGNSASQNVNVQNGSVRMGWDVLRSSDGTAQSLFASGFDMGGQPIASSTVITSGDGSYLLHMTAPIGAFNNAGLNASNWPVIIVVELPTGERIPVSGLIQAVDGAGRISFAALNRQSSPGNPGQNDPIADLQFDINLQNLGQGAVYEGWNLLAHDRTSGFQRSGNQILRPAGVAESSIITGTNLSNIHPLSLMVYFRDSNGDGMWTQADDSGGDRFEDIVVDVNCLDAFSFVMTNRGVRVGDNIDAFAGGFGAGFFLEETNRVGVFRFGPPIADFASTVFAADRPFPVNNTTLGWALVTSPVDQSEASSFLSNNNGDFLIEFNRTSANDVTITTFSGSSGDTEQINRGQAYFLHVTQQ